MALVCAAAVGLFRESLDGQAASGSRLAMAIVSTLKLIVFVCICRCASCYSSILEVAEAKKFVKKTVLPKALREA